MGHVRIPNEFIESGAMAKLGPSAFAVYVVLVKHANAAGECWPNIKTISRQAGVSERHIQRCTQKLAAANLLECCRGKGRAGRAGNHYLVRKEEGHGVRINGQEEGHGVQEEGHGVLRNKNQNKNQNKNKGARSTRFVPPTADDVREYLKESNLDIGNSADAFVDYYATRGWKLNGGVSMKDWKAACRTWASRAHPNGQAGQSKLKPPPPIRKRAAK